MLLYILLGWLGLSIVVAASLCYLIHLNKSKQGKMIMTRPTFNGDNIALALAIQALLDLYEKDEMTDRLGGLARQLLAAAAERLTTTDEKRFKKLEEPAVFVFNAPVSSGVCCCGDSLKSHGHQSDHSPVDEWDNALLGFAKELGIQP